MMANLGNTGLYLDDLNKLRVLEPEAAHETAELKEDCKDFIEKTSNFQRIVNGFINMVAELSNEVEKEKMKAIGFRNLHKSIEKQREAQQQQLLALISEKRTQLERLKVQCESLARMEAEQVEFMEQYYLQT